MKKQTESLLTDEQIHEEIREINPRMCKERVQELLIMHKELEKTDTNFHSTRLSFGGSNEFAMGYFGGQGRFYVDFLKEYFEKHKMKLDFFSEAPAGSNSISWGMGKFAGRDATCDINYWSYCISKAFLENKQPFPKYEISIALGQFAEGYLCSTKHPFPINTKKLLDGMLLYFHGNKESKPYLYYIPVIIGKWMMNNATFRGMSWDKNYMADPVRCSVDKLKTYFEKWVNKYNVLILTQRCETVSFYGDYFDFLNEIKVPQKNSVMYSDFAWAWKDGKKTDTYQWYIEDWGSILKQEKISNTMMWNSSNTKELLLKFIERCLEKYEWLFLSTQSSNYPDIDTLKEWVGTVASIKDYCFIDVFSAVANKSFREHLLVLKKKN